jgi:hypothetical protein
VFVPHWLGTEAITMFVLTAAMMRLHNVCSVVDFVLLGIERYEPLMNIDIEKLNRSNARAMDTASRPMVTVSGSTKEPDPRPVMLGTI